MDCMNHGSRRHGAPLLAPELDCKGHGYKSLGFTGQLSSVSLCIFLLYPYPGYRLSICLRFAWPTLCLRHCGIRLCGTYLHSSAYAWPYAMHTPMQCLPTRDPSSNSTKAILRHPGYTSKNAYASSSEDILCINWSFLPKKKGTLPETNVFAPENWLLVQMYFLLKVRPFS